MFCGRGKKTNLRSVTPLSVRNPTYPFSEERITTYTNVRYKDDEVTDCDRLILTEDTPSVDPLPGKYVSETQTGSRVQGLNPFG